MKRKPINPDDYLSATQAAPLLGIEPRMVKRWCQRGELGQLVAGIYLIHRDEIEPFLARKPKTGPKPKAPK